jgi:hypothetical protein
MVDNNIMGAQASEKPRMRLDELHFDQPLTVAKVIAAADFTPIPIDRIAAAMKARRGYKCSGRRRPPSRVACSILNNCIGKTRAYCWVDRCTRLANASRTSSRSKRSHRPDGEASCKTPATCVLRPNCACEWHMRSVTIKSPLNFELQPRSTCCVLPKLNRFAVTCARSDLRIGANFQRPTANCSARCSAPAIFPSALSTNTVTA